MRSLAPQGHVCWLVESWEVGVSQVCVLMRVCVEISAFFSHEYSCFLDDVLVLVGVSQVCVDEGLCRN